MEQMKVFLVVEFWALRSEKVVRQMVQESPQRVPFMYKSPTRVPVHPWPDPTPDILLLYIPNACASQPGLKVTLPVLAD